MGRPGLGKKDPDPDAMVSRSARPVFSNATPNRIGAGMSKNDAGDPQMAFVERPCRNISSLKPLKTTVYL
jgi:hypothetical protein